MAWRCLWTGMFSSDQHRGSIDDERRRLARVLPPSAVYRPPLHWPGQSPPINGFVSRADHDVTSGSRDDLAPPPAKLPREYMDQLAPSTAAAGKFTRTRISNLYFTITGRITIHRLWDISAEKESVRWENTVLYIFIFIHHTVAIKNNNKYYTGIVTLWLLLF